MLLSSVLSTPACSTEEARGYVLSISQILKHSNLDLSYRGGQKWSIVLYLSLSTRWEMEWLIVHLLESLLILLPSPDKVTSELVCFPPQSVLFREKRIEIVCWSLRIHLMQSMICLIGEIRSELVYSPFQFVLLESIGKEIVSFS